MTACSEGTTASAKNEAKRAQQSLSRMLKLPGGCRPSCCTVSMGKLSQTCFGKRGLERGSTRTGERALEPTRLSRLNQRLPAWAMFDAVSDARKMSPPVLMSMNGSEAGSTGKEFWQFRNCPTRRCVWATGAAGTSPWRSRAQSQFLSSISPWKKFLGPWSGSVVLLARDH